jgi:hypothetical protein
MDHGELHCGEPNRNTLEHAGIPLPMRNPVVDEWIARAERHRRMAQLLTELPPGYLSGLFQMQQCLETYLHAVLIAQGVPSRKCRDLLKLSGRLRRPIPGWQPDPETLNTLPRRPPCAMVCASGWTAWTFTSRASTLRRRNSTGGSLPLASAGGGKGAGSSGGSRRPRETPGLAHPQAAAGSQGCTSIDTSTVGRK